MITGGFIFFCSYFSLYNKYAAQKHYDNFLLAENIYGFVKHEIEKPVTISSAMASDYFLIQKLIDEPNLEEADIEHQLADYLVSIRNQFGYAAAYVISDKTHRYYTPGGINKIVDPKADSYDTWYKVFTDSKKDIALDTDRDQVNGYRWTVFVNVKIYDPAGRFLGVCGVGLFMDDLQKEIRNEENQHDIKINLINQEGLVQVDSDNVNIENAYISEALSDNPKSGSFAYIAKKGTSFRMTRFLDKVEWYLVIHGETHFVSVFVWIVIMAVCYSLIIVFVIVCLLRLSRKKITSPFENEGEMESIDPLTGIPNRNYLRDAYGELGVFNTTRYRTMAVFDIDNFRNACETGNGNALLKRVVALAEKAIDGHGLLFRWEKDKFVIFYELTAQEAESRLATFCDAVKFQLQITVSVGIVSVDLFESIKTNYYRACQTCYSVKELGGNGVLRK